MKNKRRDVLVLVGVALAFLLMAYLLSRGSAAVAIGDAGPSLVQKPPVVFPRDQYKDSGALATTRPPTPEKRATLDAMQRALLKPGGKGALFVEANAIRHAPLMEKMLRCRQGDSADGLSQMKEELGIDPLQDVDRVGFDGDVFIASGFFTDLKLPPELGEGTAYGGSGRIWTASDDDGQKISFGKIGDTMLVSGSDEAQVKAAMERASSTNAAATDAASELPPGFGQGEVYGTIGAAFLGSMLGDSDNPVVRRVAELVTSSTVRMNVDEDAALSLDMQAVDDKSAQELSKAIGGAFAGLRVQALQSGEQELASLLEQARVVPGENGRFNVDVAVPGEVLLRGMGCDASGEPSGEPSSEPRR